MSYVDILLPALIGAFCGSAAALIGLESPHLFWLPAALTAIFIGALVGTVPTAAAPASIAAFFLLFLIAFWVLARRGNDGWHRGNGGLGGPQDPSWWPEFEAQFRRYARHPRLPADSRR